MGRQRVRKGGKQVFRIELLHDVLGVESPADFISFENQVKISNTSIIDAYTASTRVLIEQKSIDKDLRKAIPQSDGSMLTPFQQPKKYVVEMPLCLGHFPRQDTENEGKWLLPQEMPEANVGFPRCRNVLYR